MERVKEDGGVGRRNRDYKEGVLRFVVKRQTIKKIPVRNKRPGVRIHHFNPNTKPLPIINRVKIIRTLLTAGSSVFCCLTMGNFF